MNATVLDTRSAWRAPSRIGYDATPERTVARVLPMLADERVVWLSTVRPDGTPHLCPTWFWWDGSALVVFSKPDAVKARNLRTNPRLMVAVGDPDDDFSVGLIEAEARFDADARVPDAFFAKYADELAAGRLDPATFRTTYTLAIRIVPTRFLAWHGRGGRHDGPSVTPRPTRAAGFAMRVAGTLERVSARLRLAAVTPQVAAAG
jgi:PPOX class probable F420-dependent enzyme